MNRQHMERSSTLRLKGLLILALALLLGACEANITGPTLPEWPPPVVPGNASQSVQISGTMTALDGSCFEATVLWNGREIPGGRTECREPGGCAALELSPAAFERRNGHHTIAFQVVRQSRPAQEYMVEGTVLLELENGLKFPIRLFPKRETLEVGQNVEFEIDLS